MDTTRNKAQLIRVGIRNAAANALINGKHHPRHIRKAYKISARQLRKGVVELLTRSF